MTTKTKYKYLAVTGRIPEDDEDSVYTFENMTKDEARKAFEKALYADDYSDKTPKQVRKDWGLACYLGWVFTSDSPIDITFHTN